MCEVGSRLDRDRGLRRHTAAHVVQSQLMRAESEAEASPPPSSTTTA